MSLAINPNITAPPRFTDGFAQPPLQRAHSTPDPEVPPSEPKPVPTPDDVPAPTHAPVEEPTRPEPPIRAG